MTPTEILIILALTGWAVYRQSITSKTNPGPRRFSAAAVYAAAGLIVGGFDTPSDATGWGLIVLSLTLSAIIGVVRGRCTRIWVDADGTRWQRGTALTVGLFLGLVAVKFGLGTVAYLSGVDDGAGIGEVLLMMAIMIALQTEIVRRRQQGLSADLGGLPVPDATVRTA